MFALRVVLDARSRRDRPVADVDGVLEEDGDRRRLVRFIAHEQAAAPFVEDLSGVAGRAPIVEQMPLDSGPPVGRYARA